jgi:hypothetical protein
MTEAAIRRPAVFSRPRLQLTNAPIGCSLSMLEKNYIINKRSTQKETRL